MGLEKCPDCGADISTVAAACPKCGRPTGRAKERAKSAMKRVATWSLLALVPLGILGLTWVFFTSAHEHDERLFHLKVAASNAGGVIVQLTNCSTSSPTPQAVMDALTAKPEEFHLTAIEQKELAETLAESKAKEVVEENRDPLRPDFCARMSDYEPFVQHIKELQ